MNVKKLRYYFFLFTSILLMTVTGCNGTFLPANKNLSQFDIKLTDIGFRNNTALFSSDILSISGQNLRFKVDITPKDSFKGEPFRTVELGNKDIGFQTLVQSTPAVWLALLSKDGYYFHSQGPLTWTPEELQLPDASERDYYKIQSMKERRVKHVEMFVPSSDKAAIALLQDSNKLAAELQQEQWKYLVTGDWLLGEDLPKEADEEYIRSEFEKLFNKYFKLIVVDSDGLQELKYPDGDTKLISTWSGNGTFTSPAFTPTLDRVNISGIVNSGGPCEYKLCTVDGKLIRGYEGSIKSDKKQTLTTAPVQPGESYYFEIVIPQETQWTIWVEETNLP
jgi:hypothetical protein